MILISKFKSYPMVFVVIPFILGIIASNLFSSLVFPLILLSGTAILFGLSKNSVHQIILFLLILFFCGWSRTSYNTGQMNRELRMIKIFDEKDVSFSGLIRTKNETEYGVKFLVEILDITNDDHQSNVLFDSYIYHNNFIEGEVGDTMSGIGYFRFFDGPRNPGEFDYMTFFNRKSIYGKIILNRNSTIKIDTSQNISVIKIVESIQEKIKSIFDEYLDKSTSALMAGLILGDKSNIDPEVKLSFANAGVIHILAVSGLHVGYVLLVLMICTSFFPIPWGWNRLPIILGLLFYLFITGFRPSVVRATLMAIFYVISVIFNRKANLWNIIAAVGFIILCVQPFYLQDIGFQLSFIAVISIVVFLNVSKKILPEKMQLVQMKGTGIKFILGLFLVSLGAQIGTLPLTAVYFGKIPILSVFTNIIIVPLVGILVALGFLILMVSGMPLIAVQFSNSLWFIAELIKIITEFVSSLRFATISIPQLDWMDIILYLFMLGIMYAFVYTKRWGILLIGIMSVVSFYTWQWAIHPHKMDIIFLDVGQGDAAIIRFPNQKTMLVDAGKRFKSKDYGKKVILPVSRYLGIKKFNWVVMSHPHNDHIGGVISVMNEMKVDTLFDTYGDYDSWTYKTILGIAEDKDIFYKRVNRGDIFYPDNKLSILIFAPDSAFATSESNVNNRSIVFKLQYDSVSVLFTGDLEMEGENKLVQFGDKLSADILKIGHHGSITSSTVSFLRTVEPNLAVISVGWKNKFKHPSPIVIKRLEDLNISYHRNDLDRALWLEIDGKKYSRKKWN